MLQRIFRIIKLHGQRVPSAFTHRASLVSLAMSLRERVVFVDPEDDSCPYWWPALIVPTEYIHLFQQSISEPVPLTSTDLVVCYFEDGSFSVVPEDAIRAFNVEKEPFVSYRSHPEYGRRFVTDRAVIRALKFCTEGMVPLSFTWLHSSAGSDGRLMEHKQDTLEHGSKPTTEIKHEPRRPVTDIAPQKQNEPKLEQIKGQDVKRDSSRFGYEHPAVVVAAAVGRDERREVYSAYRGKKRKNSVVEVGRQEQRLMAQPTTEPPLNVTKGSHDESRGNLESFSSKSTLFPTANSSNIILDYRIIKSLLPPPKSQLIKQILGIWQE